MLLGALALVQAAFLPGYLALRIFRVKSRSIIQTAVLSFALSVLVNYLFAFGATLVHMYTRPVVLGFVAVEVMIGVWLARLSPEGWLQTAVWVLACATLAGFVVFGVLDALRFNVFSAWDPVFQWNVWAYRWYVNALPTNSGMYPQLIPANWSMIYLIVGNPELQMFPLALMPLFPIATLAMFCDLWCGLLLAAGSHGTRKRLHRPAARLHGLGAALRR